ncbi:hypothetical protein QEZ54_21220 [Catellatospora sp. KI3]|uniref:hypothetical protein n=1 Tax=Catellatospora sp. KI3 TaxID=3041620 RepID=UPI002482E4DC|nr:hypothetical protein [Catellatospora sp. KI3]MDI1463506.1 hypothetical protein [Catellatospora sp. KI3]
MSSLFSGPVLGIRVRLSPSTGARPVYAEIVVDIEQLEGRTTGFEFVSLAHPLRAEFAAAVAAGLRDELNSQVASSGVPSAFAGAGVRATLTSARSHDADSSVSAFSAAGRLAVRAAIERRQRS